MNGLSEMNSNLQSFLFIFSALNGVAVPQSGAPSSQRGLEGHLTLPGDDARASTGQPVLSPEGGESLGSLGVVVAHGTRGCHGGDRADTPCQDRPTSNYSLSQNAVIAPPAVSVKDFGLRNCSELDGEDQSPRVPLWSDSSVTGSCPRDSSEASPVLPIDLLTLPSVHRVDLSSLPPCPVHIGPTSPPPPLFPAFSAHSFHFSSDYESTDSGSSFPASPLSNASFATASSAPPPVFHTVKVCSRVTCCTLPPFLFRYGFFSHTQGKWVSCSRPPSPTFSKKVSLSSQTVSFASASPLMTKKVVLTSFSVVTASASPATGNLLGRLGNPFATFDDLDFSRVGLVTGSHPFPNQSPHLVPYWFKKQPLLIPDSYRPLDAPPSRLGRAYCRCVGPIFHGTDLLDLGIVAGDVLYSQVGTRDLTRINFYSNGCVDLNKVTSITLGSVVYPTSDLFTLTDGANEWQFKLVLPPRFSFDQPLKKLINKLPFASRFERTYRCFQFIPFRDSIAESIHTMIRDAPSAPEALVAAWNQVISFAPSHLVADMRLNRSTAVALSRQGQPYVVGGRQDPILCLSRLSRVARLLDADYPTPVFTIP